MHFYIYATVDTTDIREIVQQNKGTVSKNMLKELFVFWFKFTWEVIKQTPSFMYSFGEENQWKKKKSSRTTDLFSFHFSSCKWQNHMYSAQGNFEGANGESDSTQQKFNTLILRSVKTDSPGKGFSKECS